QGCCGLVDEYCLAGHQVCHRLVREGFPGCRPDHCHCLDEHQDGDLECVELDQPVGVRAHQAGHRSHRCGVQLLSRRGRRRVERDEVWLEVWLGLDQQERVRPVEGGCGADW